MKLIGKTAATHAHFLVLKCPYSGRLRLLGIGKLTTSSHFGTSTHYNIPKIVYIFKKMRRFKIKTLITSIVGLAVFTILLGYLSSIVGWYGYKKWEYRVSSLNVEESKKTPRFGMDLLSILRFSKLLIVMINLIKYDYAGKYN